MNRTQWMSFAAGLLLIVSLAFVISEFIQNIDALRAAIDAPDYRFWLGASLVFIPYLIYASVWSLILRGCGVTMPHGRALMIWWTTNVAKYVPGKVWLITGRAWVARRWGTAVVIESFAWEFIIGLSSSLLAGCMLLSVTSLPNIWRGGILLLAIASLTPLISPATTQRLLRRPLSWLGVGDWTADISMSRRQYIGALLLMTSNWFIWGFALSLMCAGIGLEVSYPVLVATYSLAWGLGYASFITPAGLGVREGALTLLMAPFTLAGVGALIALLTRSVGLTVEIILFLIGFLAGGGRAVEEEE